MIGKRQIDGALDETSLPKRTRGPNERAAILIPGDEAEGDVGLLNVACPRKVVLFMNFVIDGTQMELLELEQLPVKSYRERFEDS
ncbi:unnamed protein product [Prunus brigantina]